VGLRSSHACITLTRTRGNPLSAKGFRVVEVRGFEPLASSVRGRRSAGLSYTPGAVGSVPGPAGSYSPASCRRSRSCTTVLVRSARLRSMRARATSVVRRKPPVIASG
jgi:hypothetical protein